MSQVIIASCPNHPRRPDRSCQLCLTAIDVNWLNPLWAEAVYVPIWSWAGPDAFLAVNKRG